MKALAPYDKAYAFLQLHADHWRAAASGADALARKCDELTQRCEALRKALEEIERGPWKRHYKRQPRPVQRLRRRARLALWRDNRFGRDDGDFDEP